MNYKNKRTVIKTIIKDLKKKLEKEQQLKEDYKIYFGRGSTTHLAQNELVNQIIYTINILDYILGGKNVQL